MASIRVARIILGAERTERFVSLRPCRCGATATLIVAPTNDAVFPVELSLSCCCGTFWSGYMVDPIEDGDEALWLAAIANVLDR